MILVDTELFGVAIVPEDFSEIINLATFDINNDRNIYMRLVRHRYKHY